MKTVENNYFELAIVDPPYGISMDKDHYNHDGKWGFNQYHKTDWDNKIPNKIYFDELFRISKNQIVWGGNYFVKYLYSSMGWIVWDKQQHNFSFSDGELAWTSFNKKLKIFVWNRSMTRVKEGIRIHPTQKSIALYKWLLKNYAKQGDKIFDSHVGSGSSRIACYELGYDFIGCEIDKDYWKAQEERFKLEKAKIDNEFYIPNNELFKDCK
jgi:site-specific DNA-methyltransferase (adenine-specific)